MPQRGRRELLWGYTRTAYCWSLPDTRKFYMRRAASGAPCDGKQTPMPSRDCDTIFMEECGIRRSEDRFEEELEACLKGAAVKTCFSRPIVSSNF